MQLLMMGTAERRRELVADLAPESARLSESQMMSVARGCDRTPEQLHCYFQRWFDAAGRRTGNVFKLVLISGLDEPGLRLQKGVL